MTGRELRRVLDGLTRRTALDELVEELLAEEAERGVPQTAGTQQPTGALRRHLGARRRGREKS